jgi:hypothetical protein
MGATLGMGGIGSTGHCDIARLDASLEIGEAVRAKIHEKRWEHVGDGGGGDGLGGTL